eukprot:CAMPEP_0117551246 /NCGR_PEP_ID=MMETSP0784-20121206/49096_1 /TAXON_ID=39447 /ORGANISM="" /LENGTH=512 /DNA_ID=CAMNT_0005348287 /DNA_START=38 /DNA_END=1573 /DNA_ORIENTATION=-
MSVPKRWALVTAAGVVLASLAVAAPNETAGGVAIALEEEEKVDDSAVSWMMSAMLIGGITFIMGLFYIVNFPDKDIVRYSWCIIQDTLAIFTSVMFFQATSGVAQTYIGEAAIVDFAQMLFWFVMLQFLTAMVTGAVSLFEAEEETREHNVKCFVPMMAHVTAFASITAWGDLQHAGFFSEGPLHSFAVLPVAYLTWRVMFWASDATREKLSTMDDGELDEAEESFDEETEEAENDILSLTISFLLVQATRFAIAGRLPSNLGEIEASKDTPLWEVVFLGVSTIFWLCVSMVLIYMYRAKLNEESFYHAGTVGEKLSWDNPSAYLQSHTYVKRRYKLVQSCVLMAFSWSVVFFGKEVVLLGGYFNDDEDIADRVVLAIALSALVFVLILFSDMVADKADHHRKYVIVRVIASKGLAIGFCWEQAFDTSVEVLTAEGGRPDYMQKLMLAIIVIVIVVPAYRLYIVPSVLELTKEFDEEEHARMLAVHEAIRNSKEAAETRWGDEAENFNAPKP